MTTDINRRVIYPGPLNTGDVILVTGSIYSGTISRGVQSLKLGIELEGFTVTSCVSSDLRATTEPDQVGSPDSWQFNTDILLVDMGEYLGEFGFRYGELFDHYQPTHTIFFTPVAEPSVAHIVELPWEKEHREQVVKYLKDYIPGEIHLAKPSLIRFSASQTRLQETADDVLQAIESGAPIDPALLQQRQYWRELRKMDYLPMLSRRLW